MRRFIATLLAAVAWTATAQAPAPAPAAATKSPARVALVIGNGAYPSAPLANPLNDAADIAKELEAAGFTVIRRENAKLRDMHLALREFGDKLGKTSTGLFYFAGHGVQVRGRNYLLPVDADIQREDEVAFAAMDLAAVMEKLDSARNPVNIVILDACRDNPFGSKLPATAKGFAQMDAPAGTLIAYSTAPGTAAADGGGRNGLYTGHLLIEMKKPGAPIEETFRSVRAAVRRDSKGAQVPWESTSLETEFKFRPAVQVAAAAPAAPVIAPGTTQRRVASLTMPPTLMAGDSWTWKVKNLLDGTETTRTQRIREVKGEQVVWDHGLGDLMGNFTKAKTLGAMFEYKPSTYHFVFPLRSGAVYDLDFFQQGNEHSFDAKVKLTVGEEAEIDTHVGKFKAIRIHREVKYKQRGGNRSGVNAWDYWYSPQVKRWVRAEMTNTTGNGKVLSHESWELESFNVR
jgi:hypothetical protein